MGNAATNAAYSLITSSTAQVIKACEPLFTFALTVLLYRKYEALDSSTLLSVVIIVAGAGAFLMSDASFNLWGVAAVMTANTAFPTRNIFLKKLSDVWDNPIQKFAVMSAFSVTFLLPVWLIKVIFVSGFSTSHVFDTTISSIFHSTYNLASITVLESVSPVTHAILNISKRLFVIWINIIYFHIPLTVTMCASLLVLLIGCYLYQLKRSSSSKFIALKVILLIMFFGYLFIPFPSVGMGSFNGAMAPVVDTGYHCDAPLDPVASGFSPTMLPLANQPGRSCTVQNQIMTAWIYYEPIPREAVDNIQALAEQNPETSIWVFCGTSQCVNAVGKLNNKHIRAEFAVLPDIFKDTPLQSWLALHPIHKVLAGKAFETHLQEATVLSLLWKYGGFYADLFVRVQGRLMFPECESGVESWVYRGHGLQSPIWVGQRPDFGNKHTMRIFNVAYFPRNDVFIGKLAKLFRDEYEAGVKNGAPFKFAFRNKAWDMVETGCPGFPEVKSENELAFNETVKHNLQSGKQHFATLAYGSRVQAVGVANLGDELQGFPGMQFLPFVDRFLERDSMSSFKTDGNVSMFFNAWWDSIQTWPPPRSINPVMLSIHTNPRDLGNWWANNIGWLKRHEPIGCRDYQTANFFKHHKVKVFFSGCLTLFIRNPNVGRERTDKIYLVDVKDDFLELLPKTIREGAERIHHNLADPLHSDDAKRFTEAYKLVQKYGRAKVVVTQGIHCALPCVAMGTPVIFVNSAKMPGGGGSSKGASGRTSGLTPLFHTINLYNMSKEEAKEWLENFAWDNPPPNPDVSMTMRLRATSWNVIRRNPVYYDAGRKFGVIPMLPPTNKIAGKTFVFHLVFTISNTTVIGTLSSGKKQYGAFNWRHWRSIESIFYHHPTSKVIVHSNTLPLDTFDVLSEVGYSIQVQRYNLDDLLQNSPASNFTHKLQTAKNGKHWHIHEASLLSLLILYQQGGVYVSTDTILMRPIDRFPANSLGLMNKKNDSLSDAFMAFSNNSKFLRLALSLFGNQYDSKNLDYGSGVLTSAWKRLRKTDDFLHILPYFYFNAIPCSSMLKRCFEDTLGDISKEEKAIFDSAYGLFLNSTVTGHLGIEGEELKDDTIGKNVLTNYCVLCSNLH